MLRRADFPHRLFRPTLAALLAGSLGFLAACSGGGDGAGDTPPLAGAAIGGDFALTDKAGKTVRWADFAGKYRIVYFGYTFCPDACPTDMTVAMRGLGMFARDHPAQGKRVVPIFITVDPARDTPEVVGQWTAAFSPDLVGLTGSPAAITDAEKKFGVYAQRGAGTAGGYLMDHSRIAYLMAPDGSPIAMLPIEKGPKAVAEELARWVK